MFPKQEAAPTPKVWLALPPPQPPHSLLIRSTWQKGRRKEQEWWCFSKATRKGERTLSSHVGKGKVAAPEVPSTESSYRCLLSYCGLDLCVSWGHPQSTHCQGGTHQARGGIHPGKHTEPWIRTSSTCPDSYKIEKLMLRLRITTQWNRYYC